jgi:large subunit ribosomal protein L14
MVQRGSRMKVADNSGARFAMVIGIPGGSGLKKAGVGDHVVVAVKKAIPHGIVSEHSRQHAVIIRANQTYKRKDGTHIRFDDNAVVILDGPKSTVPKGTRVFGPVARELKELGYDKIISLAPEVL